MNSVTDTLPLRRMAYILLITVAAGMAFGRIMNTLLVYEPRLYVAEDEKGRQWPKSRPQPMPSFGSNDRARWATVRSLVDKGTYVVGHRLPSRPVQGTVAVGLMTPSAGLESVLVAAVVASEEPEKNYLDVGIVFEDGWGTVDKVLKPDTQEFYSSKPPLLPTMLAGEYWVLKNAFGWSITDNPWQVMRVIVLTINWLPWVIYLLLLARLIDHFGTTDWGRLYVLTAACFATLMTPFLITLNNHTVATSTAMITLYLTWRIWEQGSVGVPKGWYFALTGLFAAFTACNELPAASFAVGLAGLLLWRFPKQTLIWFAPAALLVIGAFFWTNYQAISELTPAYSKFGSEWYEYEGSHWAKPRDLDKPGIDYARLKETRGEYAFNVLVGHHGLFSLTPIYLLAFVGMLWGASRVFQKPANPGTETSSVAMVMADEPPPTRLWNWFALFSLGISVVVIGFYLYKSDNYGGWTSGLRWLMWLTPFWLLSMLPVVDKLGQRRSGRVFAYVLLAVSVMSASYPAWNAWRHPWLYQFMDAQGWIPY